MAHAELRCGMCSSQSEWTDGLWASAYFGLYELADWEVYRAGEALRWQLD
jgi:hypothetical protein